jgi:hypothetical protein
MVWRNGIWRNGLRGSRASNPSYSWMKYYNSELDGNRGKALDKIQRWIFKSKQTSFFTTLPSATA